MNVSEKRMFSRILSIIIFTLFLFTAAADTSVGSEPSGNPGIEDGIYEDDGHFFIVSDDAVSQEVLKSFYGFWYDGMYEMEDTDNVYLAQIDNGLYLEWWNREDIDENLASGGVFWAPGSNVRELAISPYPVKDKLSGWFIVKDETADTILIYEIPYWIADTDYTEDLASFSLSDGKTAFVKKHLKIGDSVYTCAAGRRKVVRNPALRESLPGTPHYSEGGVIMVLDSPYLVKADIKDMQNEIDMHNAIIYPPRFSTMDIREPSIYKQLEEMPIEW